MLSISKEYSESIVSDTRDMPYRLTIKGGLVLDKSNVPKMSIDENIGGSEGVAIGTSNSSTLTFTMKNAEPIDYHGMLVEPESGLVLPDGSTEYVPLGKFWVIDYTTSNDFKTVDFSCADGMYHMTSEYVSRLTYPAHIRDVVHEIVAQAGVEFSELLEWPEVYVRRRPEGLTHREAIGHAAGCCGCNARFNRNGVLEFTWYTDSGVFISRRIQYLDGLTKTNYKPLEVKFEVIGQQELYEVTVISDSNGGVTATPGNSVVEGETVVLSVNPYSEYELATISAVTESGESVTLYQNSEGGYNFIQPDSNVTVTASFRRINATEFDLTVRAYDGGSIRASGEQFNEGDTVTIYIETNSGYEFDKFITIPADVPLTNRGDGAFEFMMPRSDVTVNAYFKAETVYYTINRLAEGEGYVFIRDNATGEYIESASEGTIVLVEFSPQDGYAVDRYESDINLTQLTTNKYIFVMPSKEVSITAYYVSSVDESNAGASSVCDCESVLTFSLKRTLNTDGIVINSDKFSVSAEDDTIYLESDWLYVSKDGSTLSLTIGAAPVETDEVTLSYSNPMIYEKMVEPISNLIKGVIYTPSRVKYRGNPALQAGDIVTVPDKDGTYHTVLIMQQTLSFGGGMNGEISCPGKTEKAKSFSAVSPGTTQIRKEVQKSTTELEKRLNSNNALVFNSMYSEIGQQESKIKSIVEWQTEQTATIAEIKQTANANSAKIGLVVGQNGIVNESGQAQGSVIIEAINGQSNAKIKADNIEFEGQKLDIKVDATNIEGEIEADQINADGITAENVTFTDGFFSGNLSAKVINLADVSMDVKNVSGGSVEKVKVTWINNSQGTKMRYTAKLEKPVPIGNQPVTVNYYFYINGLQYGGEATITAGNDTAEISATLPNEFTSIAWSRTDWVSFSAAAPILTLNSGIMPDVNNKYTLGTAGRVWSDIYAATGTINTSDEREKNSIAEIPQKYSDMFDKLNPVVYKLNKGTSDRYHVGFIAQEVERAMSECGIDSKEFAGLIKTPQPNGDSIYGLRYGEFIALAIGEIQRLKKKINDLEGKMNE